MGDSLRMRLSLGVGLAVWAFAMSAAAQAPAEDPNGLDSPADDDDDGGDVPVVEGEHPGVVIVEDSGNPAPPPGYGQQPLTPVPQPQQQQQPAYGQQQPGYGQAQPGYGQQQPGYGYQQPPRYHRERYIEGMQLPPNAQVVSRVRTGLLIPGIAIFAASYITMAFTYSFASAFGDPPGTMLIPLIGPFFLMPDASQEGRVLLGFDALLQIGGMTMLILGAAVKAKYVTWYGDNRFQVAPLASRSGGGLQMALRF